MDECRIFEFWCWTTGQTPSRIAAEGPESAARDYAARRLRDGLAGQAPITSRPQSIDVVVVYADGSQLSRFGVMAELTSRRLGGG